MNYNDYYQFIDNAIEELTDMKKEIGKIEGGFQPPRCNPVIINPSTGSNCRLEIGLPPGGDHDIVVAFNQWIEDFRTRLATPPGTTTDGG